MNNFNFIKLVKQQQKFIWLSVGVFLLIGLALALLQPLEYRAQARLLIVQDMSGAGADAYNLQHSNEYLSDILAKAVVSQSFLDRVLAAPFKIDTAYFGTTAKQQIKRWQKTVNVENVSGDGILLISAYQADKTQADQLVRAASYVLMTQNDNYHGLGKKVSLKLLDEPILSDYPVRPNLLIIAILAILSGLLFSLARIYLKNQRLPVVSENESLVATEIIEQTAISDDDLQALIASARRPTDWPQPRLPD